MGKDRYHYDRYGNYRGKSSDQGPYGCWTAVAIIGFILWAMQGC